MPIRSRNNRIILWTRDHYERSVKQAMELDKKLPEMRNGTIMLEGDIKVKIVGFDSQTCVVRYGKHRTQEVYLKRKFMNFRYTKGGPRVVTA